MQKSFEVAGRQYTYLPLNAFKAHELILKLAKVAGPAIKGIGLESDVSAILSVLSRVDGDPMVDIVLPVFSSACLTCDGKPLTNQGQVDALFSADTVFDLYEVAFTLIKEQVGPAFTKALARLGALS